MKWFVLFLLAGGALTAAPSADTSWVQEFRLSLEEMRFKMHSHEVETQLLAERTQSLENSIKSLKQSPSADKSLEKRVASLEKANEALVSDMKTLKNHLSETSAALAQCQNQLGKLDKQISNDIQSLKSSLSSMLALLQPASGDKVYTVQSGDSLGQIALNHKTDIKTLKKLNNLSSDVIYVGQKLVLP